ncbi:MAG: hypothetical protein LBG17_03175 [Bacteroidales bacterium]|jgi:hypothetical protein|nr:hypothetical protein [Bacteroidales bacterium]
MITRANAIIKVRSLLDEIYQSSDSTFSLDSAPLVNPIEFYIDKFLDEAVKSVFLTAPSTKHLPCIFLIKATPVTNIITVVTQPVFHYIITLPTSAGAFYNQEFLRLKQIDMDEWERPITDVVSMDSEEYRLLRNPHTTAGNTKPKAVMTRGAGTNTNPCIEIYSGLRYETSKINNSGQSASLINLRYIPSITLGASETIGGINTSQGILTDPKSPLVNDAICWRTALEVLATTNNEKAIQLCTQFYQEAIKKLE